MQIFNDSFIYKKKIIKTMTNKICKKREKYKSSHQKFFKYRGESGVCSNHGTI